MDTSGKKAAYKALSMGAKNAILKHTGHKEFYNEVLKKERRLINGRAILKRLNTKKAPKNESIMKRLLTHGGKYAGLYIGDKIGGPLGAVVGAMVGNHIVKQVDKRHGKTIFETPGMRHALELLQKEDPRIAGAIEHELVKAGIGSSKKRQYGLKSAGGKRPYKEANINNNKKRKKTRK